LTDPVSARAALPAVEPGALPREVRAGGPEAVDSFRAALGFERTLLVQLLKDVAPGRPEGGAGGEEGDAASGAHADLVPETLADALVARGGIGLARELWTSIRPESA
jgi:hypothetical protein